MAYKDKEKIAEFDAHIQSTMGNVTAAKELKSEEGRVNLKDTAYMVYNDETKCVEFIIN